MHDETLWLSPNVTEESLRTWAYDENAQFDFQDEDLLLHREEFFHVLLGMADDPDCPKADYIISCLDHYLMSIARHHDDSNVASLHLAIECCSGAKTQRLREFESLQNRRLRYRAGLGRIDREQATEIGRDLLLGLVQWGECTLEIFSESRSELIFARAWKEQHFQEFLSANLEQGTFRFKRWFRPSR